MSRTVSVGQMANAIQEELDKYTEAQVEAVLDRHSFVYDKTEVWIPEEKLYEVLYSMEVIVMQQII